MIDRYANAESHPLSASNLQPQSPVSTRPRSPTMSMKTNPSASNLTEANTGGYAMQDKLTRIPERSVNGSHGNSDASYDVENGDQNDLHGSPLQKAATMSNVYEVRARRSGSIHIDGMEPKLVPGMMTRAESLRRRTSLARGVLTIEQNDEE